MGDMKHDFRALDRWKKRQKNKNQKANGEDLVRLIRSGQVKVLTMDDTSLHYRIIFDGRAGDIWLSTGTYRVGSSYSKGAGAEGVRLLAEALGIGFDWKGD